jgi:hypothetical protein
MCWTKWKAAFTLLILGLALVQLSARPFAQTDAGDPSVSAKDDPPRKVAPSDIEKRLAELEKQVARLTDELAVKKPQQPRQPDKEGKGKEPVIPIVYTKAADIVAILKDLLGEKGDFSVGINEQRNLLLLHGPASELEKAQKIIQKLDVPTGPRRSICPDRKLKRFDLTGIKAPETAKVLELIYREDREMRVAAAGDKTLLVYACPETLLEIATYLALLEKLPARKRAEELKEPGP